MSKPMTEEDALRHVRFAGQPAMTASRLLKRSSALPSAVRRVQKDQSEGPGEFISWIFQRAGLAADCYRGEPLTRRLSACLRALHTNTETNARLILEQRPDLLPTAIGALLIGVTEFFRDPQVFETLRTHVLPHLAALPRPLRVWSAGCSNGAELYSLAIVLEHAGLLEKSYLLGSDCRGEAIEQARAGLYKSGELKKIDPEHRRYFEEAGNFWRPIASLRKHVHWKVADLARGIEKGPWDIILWRNMAIYLDTETALSLWRSLESVLAPGGVLVVGKAERPPVDVPVVNVKKCIYRSCSRDGEQ
jgi:chemotaxis protein methyltransferase CheR